jgi:hypothetical protein
MRRQLLATLAAAGVALAAAGCGVPGRTSVVVDGGSRETDVAGSISGDELPPGPEGTGSNVEEFVNRFLEAPAGDWEGAADRVKQFLSPQLRASWQAPREITVVRLVTGKADIKPPPSSEVVLDVQQIGVLSNNGELKPPSPQDPKKYTLTVGAVDAPRGGLAVTSAPPLMLLTDTALDRWYYQRPIYFWDTEQVNLVPDLRYLPRASADDARRPRVLIGWLLDGPADWLQPSVLELPQGTEQLRQAYKDNNGRLIVSLNGAASSQNLDQLFAQLVWTLRIDYPGDLVLEIENQKKREASSSDYLNRNPAYRLAGQPPAWFGVTGGVVRRIQVEGPPAEAAVPVLDAGVNKNVRYAAISGGRAALARTDGKGALSLWVGPDKQGGFRDTKLRAGAMSRPVLADGQNVGYVAAGGKLYRFSVDTAEVTEVVAANLAGSVTSVALAPDGRRLAVLAGGVPYVVALGGEGGGSTAARPLPPPLTALSGISWWGETSLAMTGTKTPGTNRGRPSVVKVSVDGAVLSTVQDDMNASKITQLVTAPENPVNGIGGVIMIEADDRAYQVFSSTLRYIQPQEVVGPPVKLPPIAPFFLG